MAVRELCPNAGDTGELCLRTQRGQIAVALSFDTFDRLCMAHDIEWRSLSDFRTILVMLWTILSWGREKVPGAIGQSSRGVGESSRGALRRFLGGRGGASLVALRLCTSGSPGVPGWAALQSVTFYG